MRCKLLVLLFFIALGSFATHNRAGYISYTNHKDIHGNYIIGYYHFKIYTYTNPTSTTADRCGETLCFTNLGTGVQDTFTFQRTNYTPNGFLQANNLAGCGAEDGSIPGDGLMLVYPYSPPCSSTGTYGGVKVNTYEGDYQFHGAGQYVFGMVDPNLDVNIINFTGGSASGVQFALLDTLNIGNYTNYNNTPLVNNPPIDNACAGESFYYNPGMYDPDLDSLSFSLIPFITGSESTSGGASFNPLSTYNLPPGNISVDPVTGELTWLHVPSTYGEYEIDMFVREWRRYGGGWVEMGSEVFAVQIYVQCCTSVVTIPPSLMSVKGCVEAGDTYTSPSITASEPDSALTMSATGVPLTAPNNATFVSSPGVNVSGHLNWTPSCNNVQLNPYYVIVNAHDNSTPPDANFSSISIQVVSPPITNFTDSVKGDTIKLNWSPPPSCGTNTTNVIVDYLIYRATDCVHYTVTPCQTGVPPVPAGTPPSSWYQPVGSTTATVFYDGNNGQGFSAGNTYSYIVIAQYADGSLSMAPPYTDSTCITLHLGVPILINVSVDTTDMNEGKMFVRWQKPLIGGLNLDTLLPANQGPYYFIVQRSPVNPGNPAGTYTTAYTSPSRSYFGKINTQADTSFIDTALNTQSNQYYYKVLFYANGHSVGSGSPASSVFASGVGHNRRVALSWKANTPWTNYKYYIYIQNGTNNGYKLVDSTTLTVDTVKQLTNKYNYCFRIMCLGSYYNPNIFSPDTNWSQKVCVAPIDDEPPCQPQLSIVGNCNESINKLTWRNPDNVCNIDDVIKYYIYYTPRQDSTMTKIDSVLSANDTTYTTNYNFATIAGCYIIVAVDSAGNRSAMNDTTCTDDCPEYELPNIFTPNGDNINDLYIPVKNKYVRSVNFVMYNRWGEVVYENTNPSLGWDGKSKQMKQPVPDGTYFYTCTVNEIHYYGIETIKLKGFVQLIK
jgi:gliding motility-associated-like protein